MNLILREHDFRTSSPLGLDLAAMVFLRLSSILMQLLVKREAVASVRNIGGRDLILPIITLVPTQLTREKVQ